MEEQSPIELATNNISEIKEDIALKDSIQIEEEFGDFIVIEQISDTPDLAAPAPAKEDIEWNIVVEQPVDIIDEVVEIIEVETVQAIEPIEEVKEVEIEIEMHLPPVASTDLRNAPSNNIKIWEAKRGSSLEKIVTKWCDQEKIKLTWSLPDDRKISKDIFISGTFKNAINVLLSKGVENIPEYSLNKTPNYELVIGE